MIGRVLALALALLPVTVPKLVVPRPGIEDFATYPPAKPLPLQCRMEEVPAILVCTDLSGQHSIDT